MLRRDISYGNWTQHWIYHLYYTEITPLFYDPNSGLLHWLHIVISNVKAFILGTYHGLPKKHFQSYLDEHSFRFSRRGFGGALVERLSLSIALPLGCANGITTYLYTKTAVEQ